MSALFDAIAIRFSTNLDDSLPCLSMRFPVSNPLLLIAIIFIPLVSLACGGGNEPVASNVARNTSADTLADAPTLISPAPPTAAVVAAERERTQGVIRTLEARLKRDPEDFVAANKLGGYYLQLQRETGDANYLDLAARAARLSLATLPAEMNVGALKTLAEVEHARHNFAAARDHATQLIKLEPRKSYPYQILGESLVELGDYERAATVYRQMQSLSSITAGTESRLARLAFLRGDTEAARSHLAAALAAATNADTGRSETVAWCQWQLGELSFATGDYRSAERHYRDSLNTFPDYFRALTGLARARAAQGDLQQAIDGFERATRILPDPTFIATLGDLYKLAGRDAEAATQYRLVEKIADLDESGARYDRQLALFYADHDMKSNEAYVAAVKEYETRPDIYGADAVAWTALKAGKLTEARAKIKEALRLDTKDAKLLYHAGMIARAAGDTTAARDYLTRALTLNPHFDLLQAARAREVLHALKF